MDNSNKPIEALLRELVLEQPGVCDFSFASSAPVYDLGRGFRMYSVKIETKFFTLGVTFRPKKPTGLTSSTFVTFLSQCCKREFGSTATTALKCEECERYFSAKTEDYPALLWNMDSNGKFIADTSEDAELITRWAEQAYLWDYHSEYIPTDIFERIIFSENFFNDLKNALEFIHLVSCKTPRNILYNSSL